jgi:hypothetical protein
MPAPPSKLVIGTVEEAAPKAGGVFLPFGDRDDPQRLAVLLAEHVAKQLPSDPSVERWADTCLDPKASWPKRRLALGDALTYAAERRTDHFITLVDVDALATQGTDDWDADLSVKMRRELYRVVLDAVERGGWVVIRPCPSRRATTELEGLGIAEEYAPESTSSMHLKEANLFAPEVRPIAAWLVHRGTLRPRDLSRIVEDVSDSDEHLIDLAYDALPPAARDAGKLLSAVRPPQHVNGALGPFAYVDDKRPSAAAVPRAAAEALQKAGFLQPGAEPSTLRMPRLVRGLLRRFAPLGMASEVRRLHARLATEAFEAKDISAKLEAHRHAVLAGDIELAKNTALFYGTELRGLATEISLEGRREGDRAKFATAADLFDYLVRNFDEADAYSWEYLGYNLARANPMTVDPRVLKAYQRAHQLWPENPLYHGRLLGFLGRMGHDTSDEFSTWLDRYVNRFGDGREAVSLFAKAALDGLRYGGQRERATQIVERKRALLERFAPRALAAFADDA